MDEDFEDLLRDEDEPEYELEASASTSARPKQTPPSENEIRLCRRVLELEEERNSLTAELSALKARFPTHSNPTVPVTDPSSSSSISQPDQPIEIPTPLLPLLGILRTHIAELTRDNYALRYTFMGQALPRRGSITQTPTPVFSPISSLPPQENNVDVEMAATTGDSGPSTLGLAPPSGSGAPRTRVVAGGLDLERVVERVKQLVTENEELGEMLLQLGQRGDEEEWKKSLDDSKAIIESLDSDLSHHLSVVESTRSELKAYKSHFGPLPQNASDRTTASSASTTRGQPAFVGRGSLQDRLSRGSGGDRGSFNGVALRAGSTNAGGSDNSASVQTPVQNKGAMRGALHQGLPRTAGTRRPLNGSGNSNGGNGPFQGHVRGGSFGQGQSARPDERDFKRRK
ncbi:hypothetical protein J005_04371 [Cryptococcus neoformans]|nr:hypothetical protein C344_04252 [Cryptococcus neoformans var. grubii AD1-7a]OXH29304.1 hypothetical protein J005_04371 [Cryptococcus neoformans var. grubii]